MTQDAVAKALGVSRPTVVQIEQGNRAVSSIEIQKLAFLFGRDLRDFFRDEFSPEDAIDGSVPRRGGRPRSRRGRQSLA